MKTSKLGELLEKINPVNESPGEGATLGRVVFDGAKLKGTERYRIVLAKNRKVLEDALKAKKVKFKSDIIDHKHYHKGQAVFVFAGKYEDTVDDIIFNELRIDSADPDSYDQDYSHAKLSK